MEQNNVRKYLLYAIGEIALVMIGILLALQVNNWNEERKADQVSEVTIQKLVVELEEAKVEVEESLVVNKMFLNWSDQYLNSESYTDSLKTNPSRIFRLISSASVTLDLPVLQQELGSEQLISDKNELSLKLRHIKNEYEKSTSVQSTADDLWNENVVGYFIDRQMLVEFNAWMRGNKYNEEAVINLMYDVDYKNLVALVNSVTIQYIVIYEKLLEHIDETIELIEAGN
ncbi:MAG: hypothetical protein JXR11_08935 [Balneola sp.]